MTIFIIRFQTKHNPINIKPGENPKTQQNSTVQIIRCQVAVGEAYYLAGWSYTEENECTCLDSTWKKSGICHFLLKMFGAFAESHLQDLLHSLLYVSHNTDLPFLREEVETGGFSYFCGYIWLIDVFCKNLVVFWMLHFLFFFKWTFSKYWITRTQHFSSVITLNSKRTKNVLFSCNFSNLSHWADAPTIALPSSKSRRGAYLKKKVISCSDSV